jgi:hypothetical protein
VLQVSTLAKMYSTAVNQYNTLKNTVEHFSAKTIWQTELNKIKTVSVPNTYGETAGFTNALNLNNQAAASMAWANSAIGLTPQTSGITSRRLQAQESSPLHTDNTSHAGPASGSSLPCPRLL